MILLVTRSIITVKLFNVFPSLFYMEPNRHLFRRVCLRSAARGLMVDADFSAVRKRSRPETSIPIDDSLTVETRQDSSNMLDFVGHNLTGLAQPQGGPTFPCYTPHKELLS